LTADPAYGGQGLPHFMGSVLNEMVAAANIAFGMYPGLSAGAYRAIARPGSDAQKKLYLPKLADGIWSGTMCLTEPQCGTDLGLICTRAIPQQGGAYRITGTKIFISAGEHDLTQNIIHLVLAKAARRARRHARHQPVHRAQVPAQGGERRDRARAAQRRLLRLDRAQDGDQGRFHLRDEPGRGDRLAGRRAQQGHARHVHNDERRPPRRRHPGAGPGRSRLSERSRLRQGAAARPRLDRRQGEGQGRRPDPRPSRRAQEPVDKAFTEGARALGRWVSLQLDIEQHAADPKEREAAADLLALMTPIVKAYFTDAGFEATNVAMQVWGGHGYIHEYGVEQFVRDARITQIYEGANGIQALDLVGRKLPANFGRSLRRFFHPVMAFIEESKADAEFGELLQRRLSFRQAQNCPLLRAQDPARDRAAFPRHHGRRGVADGPGGRGVLKRFRGRFDLQGG
jgi:hypothetical protein